jgi:hypothetical protein
MPSAKKPSAKKRTATKRSRGGPQEFKLVPRRGALPFLKALGVKSARLDEKGYMILEVRARTGRIVKIRPGQPMTKVCQFTSVLCIGSPLFTKVGNPARARQAGSRSPGRR